MGLNHVESPFLQSMDWFSRKIFTGNRRCSQWIWGCPVICPLSQSKKSSNIQVFHRVFPEKSSRKNLPQKSNPLIFRKCLCCSTVRCQAAPDHWGIGWFQRVGLHRTPWPREDRFNGTFFGARHGMFLFFEKRGHQIIKYRCRKKWLNLMV